ncbi:MAG: phosphopentomutase [Fimbriimonadaceae bacterium]
METRPKRRAVVIVLDGCGAGALPDAAEFGDHDGPSTILHVWEAVGGFVAPELERCGFLAACGVGSAPAARYARLRELSMGKDSVTGHWEMMGVVTERAFPTYPSGFPIPLIKEFEQRIGRQTIGNEAASGTEVIKELGPLHEDTGMPIVYTSADSVFQIACHEGVVPLEELYSMCRAARGLLVEPDNVQRVIARPFVGDRAGGYTRTGNRRDFALTPPLNLLDEVGGVFGVGVVPELFDGRGFLNVRRTQSNAEHAEMMCEALRSDARFIFANFEDFDMKYGHRNDPIGFARCLEEFDKTLNAIRQELSAGDLLILTADHGNDPTDASTDHSREYVPAALIGEGTRPADLGDVDGLASIGATVAAHLGLAWKTSAGRDLNAP